MVSGLNNGIGEAMINNMKKRNVTKPEWHDSVYAPVRKRLEQFYVRLSPWARIRLAAGFYSRPLIAMWVASSVTSVAATSYLISKFILAAYGAVKGTVPGSSLLYLTTVIVASCIPVAICVYFMEQIRFAFDRFTESVKYAGVNAYKSAPFAEGPEVTALAHYAYSVRHRTDRDIAASRLANSIAALLAVATCTSFAGFVHLGIHKYGTVAVKSTLTTLTDSFLLHASLAVAMLIFSAGVLLFLSEQALGSTKLLCNENMLGLLHRSCKKYGYAATVKELDTAASTAPAADPYGAASASCTSTVFGEDLAINNANAEMLEFLERHIKNYSSTAAKEGNRTLKRRMSATSAKLCTTTIHGSSLVISSCGAQPMPSTVVTCGQTSPAFAQNLTGKGTTSR